VYWSWFEEVWVNNVEWSLCLIWWHSPTAQFRTSISAWAPSYKEVAYFSVTGGSFSRWAILVPGLAFCDSYRCLHVNSTPIHRDHFFLPLYSWYLSLDAFTRLRKESISFVGSVYLSIHLSVRLKKFGCLWTSINVFCYLKTFWKTVEKCKCEWKSERNN